MTEPATPQEAPAAGKASGVIPMEAIRGENGAALLSPAGMEVKARVEASKRGEPEPVLTVTVKIMADGSRVVDVKTADGEPVALGRVRQVFKDCKEHYDDRITAHMVKVEVARAVSEAAKSTKDRNLMAKLFHALR